MKQNLKEFIDNNRDELDDYEPGKKVWKAIEDQLPGKEKKMAAIYKMSWFKWSMVAACVLLIVTSIYYFPQLGNKQDQVLTDASINQGVPEAYAEELYHFTKLIELKHKQLKKIEAEQPELYRQFAGDICRLDSNYQVLRKELPGNPNQELLIQAMIVNLKWQMDILNEQLNIIQKTKQSKNKTDEKISSPA